MHVQGEVIDQFLVEGFVTDLLAGGFELKETSNLE